jgi:hypothetical protein
MNLKHKAALAAMMVALMSVVGSAQAAFQGRLANGTPSATCTVSGAGKCTYFFDTTLNITILNNWSIGAGNWSGSAAGGSAQAVAARAGLLASGLTGWVLPTGDGGAAAGAQNQYKSIWNSVGSSFAALSGQFDGVRVDNYWSGAVFAPDPTRAWGFFTPAGFQNVEIQGTNYLAVAVRPGDVAAAVPEPQTYAMLLLGLGALTVAVRRRRP